jgi:hypothetical protein
MFGGSHPYTTAGNSIAKYRMPESTPRHHERLTRPCTIELPCIDLYHLCYNPPAAPMCCHLQPAVVSAFVLRFRTSEHVGRRYQRLTDVHSLALQLSSAPSGMRFFLATEALPPVGEMMT